MALESCIKDAGAIWKNQTMKGSMTKCILALGYLYQTNSCDELKGIMELVVWLEKSIKTSAKGLMAERKKEENKM
eukprot:596402-Heterocapsa_arctica.AAC.1